MSSANGNNDTTSNKEITTHEALLAEDDRIKHDPNYMAQQFPVLASTIKPDHQLYPILNNYAYDVMHPAQSVQSEKDLKRIFYKRDAQIIPMLHGDIFDPLAIKNPDFFVGDAGRKLQAELQKIGMQCIYAEGMYVALGATEMLPDAMKQYGSEVFKLYSDFLNAYGNAVGGEYPYMDLSGEMRMVAIGEIMLDKYPKHEYTQAIQSDFEFALHTLTDIHTVKGESNTEQFYALSTDPYPYMTNFEEHERFIATYPDTKYGKIVQKIRSNTSQINYNGGNLSDLYLLVLQWRDAVSESDIAYCDDIEAIKDSLYLNQGIDVPHVLPIFKDSTTQCALTYRFYPEKNKAEQALKNIQSQVKTPIGIVKIHFNTDSEMWEVTP